MITQNPFTGRSKKSLANVTATTWKGKNVLKAKATAVANPKTSGQVAQRSLFSQITKFAYSFNFLIANSWRQYAVGMTERNAFSSENLKMLKETLQLNATVTIADLKLVKGNKKSIYIIDQPTLTGTEAVLTYGFNNVEWWPFGDTNVMLYLFKNDGTTLLASDVRIPSSVDGVLTANFQFGTVDLTEAAKYVFFAYNTINKEYANAVVGTLA